RAEKIKELIGEGHSRADIAKKMKIDERKLYAIATRAGLELPTPASRGVDLEDPKIEKLIRDRYKAGATVLDIQKELRCKRIRLIERMHDMGIHMTRGRRPMEKSASSKTAAKSGAKKPAAKSGGA